MHHAKACLVNAQEKHTHIRQLYKLLITQGVDILSAVQQPVSRMITIYTYNYLSFILFILCYIYLYYIFRYLYYYMYFYSNIFVIL